MIEPWQKYIESVFWTLPVLAILYSAAEAIRPLNSRSQFLKRKEKVQDVIWLVFNELFTQRVPDYFLKIFFFFLGLFVYDQLQAKWGITPIKIENSFALFLILFISKDFLTYWIHRYIHNSWLWRFHMLHHSSKSIDWLSGFRGYWVDNLVMTAVSQLPFLLFSYDVQMVWIFTLIDIQTVYFIHTNTKISMGPFKYIFNCPVNHHVHHMVDCKHKGGQNFGAVLMIWDRVFGTYHEEENINQIEYGLSPSTRYPDSFFQRMLYPFKKHP